MKRLMTIAGTLRWAGGYLAQRGVPSPCVDAEYLLAHILGCQRKDLLIYPDRVLKDDEATQFNACVERRGRREPLQYITGEVEFRGLVFRVNRDVLIPRPETELLVDEVFNSVSKKDAAVLDLCTGSGCIAISIAKELADSRVYAADISEGALAVAKENASRHGVGERITFLTGDLFEAIDKLDLQARTDVIVSNPPYVSAEEMKELQPEIKDYEPASALFGGEDGLDFYRRIIRESPSFLAPGGLVIMEMGYGQAGRIRELFASEEAFVDVKITDDMAGIGRIISVRYVPKK